jgi:hypothetical protein
MTDDHREGQHTPWPSTICEPSPMHHKTPSGFDAAYREAGNFYRALPHIPTGKAVIIIAQRGRSVGTILDAAEFEWLGVMPRDMKHGLALINSCLQLDGRTASPDNLSWVSPTAAAMAAVIASAASGWMLFIRLTDQAVIVVCLDDNERIWAFMHQPPASGFEAATAEADEFCRGLRGPVGSMLVVLAKAGRSIGCTVDIDEAASINPTPAAIANATSVIETHIKLAGGPAAFAMAWGSQNSAAFAAVIAAAFAAWSSRIMEVRDAGGVPVVVLCINEAGGTWPYLSAIERSAT